MSDGEKKPSYSMLITRPFTFTGNRLLVNIEPVSSDDPCEVRVEMLAGDHYRITAYTFEVADPITQDGLANLVSWNGSADVSKLQGHPVKLKFYFKNARIYSFQFVE
jgi:hypothetical protein